MSMKPGQGKPAPATDPKNSPPPVHKDTRTDQQKADDAAKAKGQGSTSQPNR